MSRVASDKDAPAGASERSERSLSRGRARRHVRIRDMGTTVAAGLCLDIEER